VTVDTHRHLPQLHNITNVTNPGPFFELAVLAALQTASCTETSSKSDIYHMCRAFRVLNANVSVDGVRARRLCNRPSSARIELVLHSAVITEVDNRRKISFDFTQISELCPEGSGIVRHYIRTQNTQHSPINTTQYSIA
jgi:hypothetical protein